jgi:hypothetical protein
VGIGADSPQLWNVDLLFCTDLLQILAQLMRWWYMTVLISCVLFLKNNWGDKKYFYLECTYWKAFALLIYPHFRWLSSISSFVILHAWIWDARPCDDVCLHFWAYCTNKSGGGGGLPTLSPERTMQPQQRKTIHTISEMQPALCVKDCDLLNAVLLPNQRSTLANSKHYDSHCVLLANTVDLLFRWQTGMNMGYY